MLWIFSVFATECSVFVLSTVAHPKLDTSPGCLKLKGQRPTHRTENCICTVLQSVWNFGAFCSPGYTTTQQSVTWIQCWQLMFLQSVHTFTFVGNRLIFHKTYTSFTLHVLSWLSGVGKAGDGRLTTVQFKICKHDTTGRLQDRFQLWLWRQKQK